MMNLQVQGGVVEETGEPVVQIVITLPLSQADAFYKNLRAAGTMAVLQAGQWKADRGIVPELCKTCDPKLEASDGSSEQNNIDVGQDRCHEGTAAVLETVQRADV